MNAVEIEEAVSALFEQDFDKDEFPFQFLEAFGNKSTTTKRLRSGSGNKSDIEGAILQHNNIHIAVTEKGKAAQKLQQLRRSSATAKNKVKYILATDGEWLEAENLTSDASPVACDYADFPDHFGYFLALAGISTVDKINENSFDIRATSRLNKLYVELLKKNPKWSSEEKRQEMNHFMARLVFCFFAEDTDIFSKLNLRGNHEARADDSLFTSTVDQMSESDGSNVHEIIEQIFKVMDIKVEDRDSQDIPRWAASFPYVNGELFSGNTEVPVFSKIARSYLINIGNLDWTKVNPDIFGSMIQAVADDEERGDLGMHYTSVPNILKVLNPLFLDDLREKLEEAGDSPVKLLNLRNRMSKIRVFDPACGSGNFLVIAYKEMREIEAEINKRRKEPNLRSVIRLTNFRGIEIKHFSAEIARLALVIAEYQADVLYRGQQEAIDDLLPLSKENWIKCGNALRLDWSQVCPANEKIDATYICGNPPYKGRNRKGQSEKDDTSLVFADYKGSYASLDYVANWFLLAAKYCKTAKENCSAAFVSTNSICQGEQVSLIWPIVFNLGLRISFAHKSFTWANLASDKAGVTVIVVGLSKAPKKCLLYTNDSVREVQSIGPYLIADNLSIVSQRSTPLSDIDMMYLGSMAKDGGNLIMSAQEGRALQSQLKQDLRHVVKRFYGSAELIHSKPRACLWIDDDSIEASLGNLEIKNRIDKVREFRKNSTAKSTQVNSKTPHRFVQVTAQTGARAIVVPRVSSENREYLPVGYLEHSPVIGDKCYAIYDSKPYSFAVIASKLHLAWIAVVCSRLRTDFSYGNKLGWNTFPIPALTEKNKEDLTRCAEDILLARESHYPATIADLYKPDQMPDNLRQAHERNDEVLERIYIGRKFKNDTERLEKLFEMYAKMIEKEELEGAK